MLLWTKANVVFLKEHRVERSDNIGVRSLERRHSDPSQLTEIQPLQKLKDMTTDTDTDTVGTTVGTTDSTTGGSGGVSGGSNGDSDSGSLSNAKENDLKKVDVGNKAFPEQEKSENRNDGDSTVAPSTSTSTGKSTEMSTTTPSTATSTSTVARKSREASSNRGRQTRNIRDNGRVSRRQVQSQPPMKSSNGRGSRAQSATRVPVLLRKYEVNLFLAGWNLHPNEVSALHCS